MFTRGHAGIPTNQNAGRRVIGTHVVVVIATAGRPGAAQDPIDAVAAMVPELHADGVTLEGIVSAPDEEDVRGLSLPAHWRVVLGARGSSAQRNAALSFVPDHVFAVFFFDDDAIPRRDYISTGVKMLRECSLVVGLTGNVIANGVNTRIEISRSDASIALAESVETLPYASIGAVDLDHRELYGCNFAIRWARLSGLRFDSRLPLYSWLEDLDFASRALELGRLAKVSGCVVVHRGSVQGDRRAYGRLGYSQVANPVYLWQKGSISCARAARSLIPRVGANLVFSVVPNSFLHMRRGRLRGNLLAMRDLLLAGGKARPEGMLAIRK